MKNFLFSFLVICTLSAKSQDIFSFNEGWVDITLWYHMNENVKVGGDYGYRTIFEDFSFHRFYLRPTISWKPNKLYSLSFAISDFYTRETDAINANELRFAQEAALFWPKVGPIRFDHRLRFEERFYTINEAKENSWRVRYRLGAKSPNFNLFNIGTHFYSAVTWERFVNLGSSFEDVFGSSQRWEIVFGNQISKKVKVGLHYIFQYAKTSDDTFKLQEHIFRLRMGYTFN